MREEFEPIAKAWRALTRHKLRSLSILGLVGVLIAPLEWLGHAMLVGDMLEAMFGPAWFALLMGSVLFKLVVLAIVLWMLWRIGVLAQRAERNSASRETIIRKAALYEATALTALLSRQMLMHRRADVLSRYAVDARKGLGEYRDTVARLESAERIRLASDRGASHHMEYFMDQITTPLRRAFAEGFAGFDVTTIEQPPAVRPARFDPELGAMGSQFCMAENEPFIAAHKRNLDRLDQAVRSLEGYASAQAAEVNRLAAEAFREAERIASGT